MRSAISRLCAAIGFLAALSFAIANTNAESWLTVWFLMFIFGGIPWLLLSLRDLILARRAQAVTENTKSWLLLHVCAFFGAALGLGVYYLAKISENPAASRQAWLVVIFPALVYLSPILLALQGGDGFLRRLFRRRSHCGDVTPNNSLERTREE